MFLIFSAVALSRSVELVFKWKISFLRMVAHNSFIAFFPNRAEKGVLELFGGRTAF